MHANHRRELLQESVSGLDQCWIRRIFKDPRIFCR